jgi:hypothetical protein
MGAKSKDRFWCLVQVGFGCDMSALLALQRRKAKSLSDISQFPQVVFSEILTYGYREFVVL